MTEGIKITKNVRLSKVIDGGQDNFNAMFAAEREAWLKEKETLRQALAHKFAENPDSFASSVNAAHILKRYLRAESHRKALVWQKRYLMVSLRCHQEQEQDAVDTLSRFNFVNIPPVVPKPTPERRFRVAVCVVRAMTRMQFLVEHRRRAHENACRLLQRALNSNNGYPHRVENLPDPHTLWKKPDSASASSSVQPGTIAELLVEFNTIQDRIKNTISSTS